MTTDLVSPNPIKFNSYWRHHERISTEKLNIKGYGLTKMLEFRRKLA